MDIEGQRYPIRAGVHTLGGYSAHADQKDLVNFIGRMRVAPRRLVLVHGAARAKQVLREVLRTHFPKMDVRIGH